MFPESRSLLAPELVEHIPKNTALEPEEEEVNPAWPYTHNGTTSVLTSNTAWGKTDRPFQKGETMKPECGQPLTARLLAQDKNE